MKQTATIPTTDKSSSPAKGGATGVVVMGDASCPVVKKTRAKQVSRKGEAYRIRQLTERDYAILEHLSWGPSNVSTMSKKFFKQPTDNGKPSKSTAANQNFYAFNRLRQLQSAGYIELRRVNNIRRDVGSDSRIAVLQPAGAREVVRTFPDYEIDNIKQSFPKDIEVLHDIMVASTIRKFVEEAKSDLYKIEYIHTEYFVRKAHGKVRNGKRGSFFPDCRIRIVPHKGAGLTIDVEVDAGSMGRSQVFNKISSFNNMVLIVSPSAGRLTKLFHYLTDGTAKAKEKNPSKDPIKAPIALTLWNDFLKDGCRFGKVLGFPSGELGVLPIVHR